MSNNVPNCGTHNDSKIAESTQEISKVGIYLAQEDAVMPTRAYEGDVGYDIYAVEDYTIPVGVMVEIKTGIHLVLPKGVFAQVNTRSSHGKNGFYVHHGVIDPGYTGEVSVFFFNICGTMDDRGVIKKKEVIIKKGDKIAQILFHKGEYPELERINTLPETERGEKGFGSSGK